MATTYQAMNDITLIRRNAKNLSTIFASVVSAKYYGAETHYKLGDYTESLDELQNIYQEADSHKLHKVNGTGNEYMLTLGNNERIYFWTDETATACNILLAPTPTSTSVPAKPEIEKTDLLENQELTIITPSPAATIQPTIWQDATPEAQVNDVIRRPFTPIARVVSKEVLKDGRTCLFVTFPGCRDRHAEEWVLPAVEVVPEPTKISETDQQPPGRGDGRGRVQLISEPIEPQDNASDKEWAEYEKALALWLKHSSDSPLSKSYKNSYKGKSIEQQKEEKAAEKCKAQANATALLPIFVKRHLENRAYDEIRKAKGDYIDAGSPSVQSSEDTNKTKIFSAKMSLKQKKAIEIYTIIAKQKAYKEYNRLNTQQGL